MKAAQASVVHVLDGENTDSGNRCSPAVWDGHEEQPIERRHLHTALVECRVIKSEAELELLRYTNAVSSKAHIEVMKAVGRGDIQYEFQMESLFCHHVYMNGGCRYFAKFPVSELYALIALIRHVSYTCICGSGPNSATLHYGHAGAPNNRKIGENDMLLLDMGMFVQVAFTRCV